MKTKITKYITILTAALTLTAVCTPCTYAATYLKGDVTCDGQVNLNDAQKALRVALGIDSSNADIDMRGDIDGDGKLNLRDVQQILRAALGITSLGTGETNDGAGTGTDEHEHDYKPVYRTVHHDEVGHMETVTVEAWEEPVEVTEEAYVCNGCDKVFGVSEYGSDYDALDELGWHLSDDFFDDCENYRTEKVTYTYYVHHDAGTEQKYIVDKEAYDERVIDHYECSCGAKEDEPEPDAPVHKHVWKDDVQTVTEEVTKDAWEEPVEVTDGAHICNTCGKVFGYEEYGSPSDALKKLNAHQRKESPDCAGYHYEEITYTYYVHHDAETETVTHEVITGRTCTECGKHEDKSEQDAPAFEDTECDHEWAETTEHFNAEDEKEWGVTEEAYEETIEESAYICNGCGKIFRLSEYGSSSNAGAAHSAHVYIDKCSGGYHTDKVTTTISNPAKEGWIGATVTSRTCNKCNKSEEISRVPDTPIKH